MQAGDYYGGVGRLAERIDDARDGELYEVLSAEFPKAELQHDKRGGAEFDYITGEQCTSRLNETLGPGGWTFRVLEHGINVEADEVWVLGELGALFSTGWVYRQQFGSQKIKRSRESRTPLDIGFDLKGATTDCLKKCSTLVGVALHLYEKQTAAQRAALDAEARAERQNAQNGQQRSSQQQQGSGQRTAPPDGASGAPGASGGQTQGQQTEPAIFCEADGCGAALEGQKFRDGTVWDVAMLVAKGRERFKLVLCMEHLRQAIADADKAARKQSAVASAA